MGMRAGACLLVIFLFLWLCPDARAWDAYVVRVEDGVLYFRMLGQCSNCPSAVVTAEELVAPPILEAIPELRQVVLDTTVSDELWQDAMELLRRRHAGEA